MSLFRRLFSFSNKEIEATFVLAKPVFSGSGIKVLRAPREESEQVPGKLLIVIPRASGNACKRNRFRRRVKALFFQEKWYNHPGIWVLIVYKRAIENDFDAIKALMQKALPLMTKKIEKNTQESNPLILSLSKDKAG